MAANDDALALYGAAKTMVDAMKLREKVLDVQMAELDAKTAALSEKTAALGAVIAELKQLPIALGKHTSHYIGEGVRKAIQDDFTRPIAEAVSGPIVLQSNQRRDLRRPMDKAIRVTVASMLTVRLELLMFSRLRLYCLTFACLGLNSLHAIAFSASGGSSVARSEAPATVVMARLPLEFEPLPRQTASPSEFLTRSGSLRIGISATELDLELKARSSARHLGITLQGADRSAAVSATEKSLSQSNYLLGNDPSRWRTQVPHFGRLTYTDVYPGVDLTFYGNGQHLEHDFIVKPGTGWEQIRMRYDGATSLFLDTRGNLHVLLPGSEVVMQTPAVYQIEDGRRRERKARYVLHGRREVSFAVEGVDRTVALVIDPVLDFSTYLANLSLYVNGIATDSGGNTYIVGETFSSNFPVTAGVVQPSCGSCPNTGDIFVTKINAAGTAQVYSTFIGGNNNDQPDAIAVDLNGNAVVTGFTSSTDYPLRNPIASGVASNTDGFVTSLSPDGSSFNFSSRLGGSSSSGSSATTYPGAVTTDSSGNVYVSGTTESPYLPVTSGALNAGLPGYSNPYIFLTKLQLSGALSFSALVGSPGAASGGVGTAGLAVDSAGNISMAGTVGQGPTYAGTTTPWPTTSSAYQTVLISPNQNAPFVAKVSADGSRLLYSTLAGSGHVSAMTLDPQGEALLAGTPGSGFPVSPGAYQTTVGNSFIAKVGADGAALPYSTYFGSSAQIASLALDGTGNLWLAGRTGSRLTLVNPLQSNFGSGSSNTGFIVELDPLLQTLRFSSYFNGFQGGSILSGLAIDAQSRVHLAGTALDDLPTTTGAYLTTVTPPPANYFYTYGFAAVIDPATAAPAVCDGGTGTVTAQVGTSGYGSFKIINCGTAVLTISGVQLQSTLFSLPSSTTCVGTLAAGASCSVNYTFTPVTTGSASAVAVVSSNAPVPSHAVTVTGFGTAPQIVPVSTQITFPIQVLGVAGNPLQFLIVNQGTAPLTIDTLQTTIAAPFSVVSTTCTSPVPPSSSCVFVLSYQPIATGNDTGTFTLFSNDPLHPRLAIALSGTTLATYTAPTVSGLRPTAILLNSAATLLYVSGTNFFPASTIVVDGEPLPTTFVSSNMLTTTVDASLLTSVGELPVTVVNPAPGGASTSTPLPVFRGLSVSAASLIYEPNSKLLYISIPSSATSNANTVVSVDPVSGAMGTPIPVGNNPGKLAVAADGSSLYVGVNGAHTLQRINLATQQVDRTFPLPIDSLVGATTVNDMHVVPGSPQSVAVSLSRPASPGEAGAALYDDSGLVSFIPNDFSTHNYSLDSFAFTASPNAFYGFPFASSFFGVTQVSASALTPSTSGFSCCTQLTGSLIASDGTLLYTNSGEIWNPISQTLVGTLQPTSNTYPLGQFFYEPSVVPDASTGRTFFLDSLVNGDSIFTFNSQSFAQTGVISIPVLNSSTATDLVRWGVDGLAFRLYDYSGFGTSDDQVVILRSSLTQNTMGGTPSLATLTPATAASGSASFTLALQGSGFIPSSQVFWNGTVRQTTFVSASQLTSTIPFTDLAQAGTAQITVANPGGGTSPALTFAISGPPLTLSSQALSFGGQPAGVASAPMTLTLTNAGTVSASLSALLYPITGANAADFTASTTCTATLAAGAQCSLAVIFKPTATSAESASLALSAPGETLQVVALTGTGVTPVLATFSPATAIAGSATFTLTLQGSGFIPGAQVLWNGTTRQTTFVSAAQITAIIPSTDLAQTGTAQVTAVNPGGGTSPALTFAISGPPLTLSSQVLSFGSQPVGVASAPMTLTLTNAGTVSASLSALSYPITGANSTDFTASTTCTATLAAGAQCSLAVVFKPTATSAESASLTLSVPGETSQVVALTGTGVTPDFTFTPIGAASATVTAGQSASYNLVLTPVNGFSGSVILACANLPTHASCSFSPAAVSGSTPTTVTVNVTTQTTTASIAAHSQIFWAALFPLGTLMSLPLWAGRRRIDRRWSTLFSVTVVLSVLAFATSLTGCGGSSPAGPAPPATTTTPAGTYTFTVTSTSGSSSHSTPLTLVVQESA